MRGFFREARRSRSSDLELGFWDFSGIWSLGFAIFFSPSPRLKSPRLPHGQSGSDLSNGATEPRLPKDPAHEDANLRLS